VTERIASPGSGPNHANEMKGLNAACKEDLQPKKSSIKKIEGSSVLSVDETP
jgi:hypothetical protein